MPFPIFIADAFVGQLENRVLRGNPAAVMILDGFCADEWLQNVAAEFNLSETAFLCKRTDDDWDLRWFTPTTEVGLCGHATLASSHVVWQTERVRGDELRFHTRSGVLGARRMGEQIALDFPAVARQMLGDLGASRHAARAWKALGLAPNADGRAYSGGGDWLFHLESADAVSALAPDFAALKLALEGRARGAIVTARAEDGANYDFVSRFFGPNVGINEDPVTGSAHCVLAPFWSGLLGIDELTAVQLSPRGGLLYLQLYGQRVEIMGQSKIRVRGQWLE